MIDVQFVTVPGCVHCKEARKIFDEIQPSYPDLRIEEVEPTDSRFAELISKHSIFSSPGIIINGELFSTGALNKQKFIEKLKTLAQHS